MTSANRLSLPVGTFPKALRFDHFPTAQQAVVWRNWELVPVERLAAVLGTSPESILALAHSMGLRVPPVVNPLWLERGYCTLIRINWHLLPYEQLLQLLQWSPEQLAATLREDDFLWTKLGMLKPDAEPVCHTPLNASQERQTRFIRELMETHFPEQPEEASSEPPFAFLKHLRNAEPTASCGNRRNRPGLRLAYSYDAPHGDALMYPELDPYPDALLDRLAAFGVNGVWLPAILYKLVPLEGDAALSKGHEVRLGNLRALARRVAKKGIGLYLYLNEPRAVPASTLLFDRFPQWKGLSYHTKGTVSLCTSNREVLDHLKERVARLFAAVPELAGILTITMSECPTHCHSHRRGNECPRCCGRQPAEVIAEVVQAMEEGAHSANPDARVICWDWAWQPEWAHELVDLLPERVALMCTSEWGLPLHTKDKAAHALVDYSISKIGPSARSASLWKHARNRGLKTIAKVQINNSWELFTVPFLPVPYLVEQHLDRLAKEGVDGLMLSWTVGGYPGGNLELLVTPPAELAGRKFGAKAAPIVCEAWRAFSEAFALFPFSSQVIYTAPHNSGPANLLYSEPTGYRATMVQGFPYDDLASWRAFYGEDEFESLFLRLCEGWLRGLEMLDTAAPLVENGRQGHLAELKRIAHAAYCHFRSCYLQIRFVRVRQHHPERKGEIKSILDEELDLAKSLHALAKTDSRLGFEAANHYAYTLNDLREKALNCAWLKEKLGKLKINA